MDRCTGCCVITEILLKTVLNSIQSTINQLEIVICKLFEFGGVQIFLNLSFGKGLRASEYDWLIDYFRLFIVATGCPSERCPPEDG